MAQVDVKWPSEDEDFDAKTEGNESNESEATKVAVTDGSDATQAQPESNDTQTEETPVAEEASATDNSSEEASTAAEEAPQQEAATEVADATPEQGTEQEADQESDAPSAPEVPAEKTEQPAEVTSDAAETPATDDVPEEPVTPEAADNAPEPENTDTKEEFITPEAAAAETAADPAPEPGSSITPEVPSEPVASDTPAAAVNDSAATPEATQAAPTVGKKVHHYGRDAIILVLVLLVAGVGLWSWTLYNDKKNLQQQLTTLKANPQEEINRQVNDLVAKVSKVTSLPTTEQPTVQTVTDANVARKQADFYAKAEDGDKVLLYVNSRKAFLYRPSTNKVITISPIQISNTQTSVPASRSTTQ
ncbi:MAG: hypothetical protein U0524_03620 [Candidatus Saccharimonadales bacterium]